MKWLLIVGVVAAGCAHDIAARYPSQPTEPTGTLVLQLTKAADGVTVAVNGMLVVDDAHTQRVVVTGVPTGQSDVVIAANGGDKAFHVWIDSSHATTVPLGVPDEGSGFIKSLAGSLLTIVVYSLLHR
ncbi:MAG TPA: hypothetical protein VL326_21010 [Kofleriaceae bacterium]|nr:hypothetical protein [Kofleriaceae bacterium]